MPGKDKQVEEGKKDGQHKETGSVRAQPQYVSIISAAPEAINRFMDRATFFLI